MLKTKGWQLVSFNCIDPASSSFDGLQAAPFNVDDKILSRDGQGLTFATYNGMRLVGNLVNLAVNGGQGLSYARGYKIYFTGVVGSVIQQSGEAQFPVEDVVLSKGWTWIGHAPLMSYRLDSGITTVGGDVFTADDQIKTRSGGDASCQSSPYSSQVDEPASIYSGLQSCLSYPKSELHILTTLHPPLPR